jgi:hypothetical protein
MLDIVARRYGKLPTEVMRLSVGDLRVNSYCAVEGEKRDAEIEAAKWGAK